MWLLSDSIATAAALPVPGIPPMLSSRTAPAKVGLFTTISDESIIWLDSDSVLAGGGTFSQLPSPDSTSAQSILKRVTLGHVAKMFLCSWKKTIQCKHLNQFQAISAMNYIFVFEFLYQLRWQFTSITKVATPSGVLLKMEVGIRKGAYVAKGLKVPCLFMITEVSIRCQKTRRLVYGVYPRIPPNTPLTTPHSVLWQKCYNKEGCWVW